MTSRSLVILDKNKILASSGNKFIIYTQESKKQRQIPSFLIDDVIVHIENNIKPSFLKACSKLQIPVHFINKNYHYYGSFFVGNNRNIMLRNIQYSKRLSDEFCLSFSTELIKAKRNGQLWVLRSVNRNATLPEMKGYLINNINELLGIEGAISQVYWSQFSSLIKNDHFLFSGRVKNPPADEVNSLLSYGYSLLVCKIITNIKIVGLDPYFGFYHSINYRRPSLALDLMEEFRPIAVDKLVLNLINKKIIKKEDFINYYGVIMLTKRARALFIKEWLDWWFKRKFYVKSLKDKFTLSELSLIQARTLVKTLTEEIPSYRGLNILGSA